MSEISPYDRLVKEADPQDLEQINAEAFAKLTPEQRESAFTALTAGAANDDDRPKDSSPEELARAATAAQTANGRGDFGADTGLFNVFVAYAIGSELGIAYLAAAPLTDGFGGGFDNPDGFDIV